jgi:hypothetical protein
MREGLDEIARAEARQIPRLDRGRQLQIGRPSHTESA